MKISVITVVYNNVKHIADCIKSVIAQSYPRIEYIVVDGRSTDGTMGVINRHRPGIAKIISEKDDGYVYAMNKGLEAATGDVVGFLHSDDFYAHDKVIENVASGFRNNTIEGLYGDLAYTDRNNTKNIIRCWKAGGYDITKIRGGWMPPHPTFFVRRAAYKRRGYFNTDFRIAADYEMMLRLLYKNKISVSYLPEVLVKMRWGGASNRSLWDIIKKSSEDYRICRMYGFGLSTLIMKNINKIPQFFIKE